MSTSPFQHPSHTHPQDKILAPAECPTCLAERKCARATDGILACLTVLCPPAVAHIKSGRKQDVWLNLGLTLLGWGPGMLHAWYLILLHPGVHHRHDAVREHCGGAHHVGTGRGADPEYCYRDGAAFRSSEPHVHGGHQGRYSQYADVAAITTQGTPISGRVDAAHSATNSERGGENGHWRIGEKKDVKQLPPSYAASS